MQQPCSATVVGWLGGGEPLRTATLAARSGLDASTVSRHVTALEGDGSLERCPGMDDRRACRVGVTERVGGPRGAARPPSPRR